MNHHCTTFVLQSVHRPTEDEVEKALSALLLSATHSGFEPLRATAVFEELSDVGGTRSPTDEANPCGLQVSRVLTDVARTEKWENSE